MSQAAGMTLRFWDAFAIVGDSVIDSSGSTISASNGATPRACSSTPAGDVGRTPITVSSSASTSGMSCCSGSYAPSASISGAAFTRALSAMPGIDAWPLRPCTRNLKGALIFSDTEHR